VRKTSALSSMISMLSPFIYYLIGLLTYFAYEGYPSLTYRLSAWA
jgi:hypothetical protein